MLRNYLTIALRTLRRQKGYTAINILGLAVGMTACLLIGLYVEDELTYDAFHEDADAIMVVGIQSDFFGLTQTTPYPLATLLAEQVPEVKAAVRTNMATRAVSVEEGTFEREQRVLMVDSTFFDVFSFPMERGNPATALDAPRKVVVSASMAKAFFGEANPVGRTLSLEAIDTPVTVAGVVRVPSGSTLTFDMVAPAALEPVGERRRSMWGMFMYNTYARLHQPMDPDAFSETVMAAAKPSLETYSFALSALPLPELYLSDMYDAEGFNGQRRYAYLFGTIALLILAIAAINYVNLVTAQANQRAREVGVRKTIGAHRTQVAQQFIGETVLLSLGALAAALVLTAIALPGFNVLFSKSLTLWSAHSIPPLAGLSGFVLLVTLAAGTYPAVVLSGFQPVRALRGASRNTTSSGGWLRKGLVVTQFAVSAALILGTVVILQQLDYVQTKNLGFDGEQVVTLPLGDVPTERHNAIKQEVMSHPDVQEAAVGGAMPGGFNVSFQVDIEDVAPTHASEQDKFSVMPAQVDADYIQTLGLELLAGRSFSADRPTDRTRAYVLNREAADQLGWTVDEAIGQPFTFGKKDDASMGEVIGVVENFHIASLRNEIDPVVLQMEADRFSSSSGILAAKLAPEGIRAGTDHIESVLASVAPDVAFDYAFLDDEFDAMYRSEERLASIFAVFAGIAIFVACMGLFGLAAFAAQRRTKEIGIRKVLGASLADVMGLLSKEFALLIGIALVVGSPIAYWTLQEWLQDFAYRVSVGPMAFALTAGVAFVIAGASVSYHAIRAAQTDPARALRSE